MGQFWGLPGEKMTHLSFQFDGIMLECHKLLIPNHRQYYQHLVVGRKYTVKLVAKTLCFAPYFSFLFGFIFRRAI